MNDNPNLECVMMDNGHTCRKCMAWTEYSSSLRPNSDFPTWVDWLYTLGTLDLVLLDLELGLLLSKLNSEKDMFGKICSSSCMSTILFLYKYDQMILI